MTNLYKILPSASLNAWKNHKVGSIGNTRHSLDGTKCIIKLPVNIQEEADAVGFQGLFNSNKPFLTHSEAREEMAKPEWTDNSLAL